MNKFKTIANRKAVDPDSIDQTVEALKLFNDAGNGNANKIEIQELRWAMTKLGDFMDEKEVDDMIATLDPEKSGFIDIQAHANYSHAVKEEKEDKKKKDGAKKKK